MAVGSGKKRKWTDDLDIIPTFSDSDDVPDLDEDQDEIQEGNAKKQKKLTRHDQKKLSKKRTADNPGKAGDVDDESEAPATWTSRGHDDGAFGSDFEFEDANEAGVIQAFNDWGAAGDLEKYPSQRKAMSIEDIIERRRQERLADTETETVASRATDLSQNHHDGSSDHDDAGSVRDHASGMAANPEREDEDDPSNGSDAEIGDRTQVSDDDDDDEEAISAPMPDVGAFSDEDDEDPDRIAKRDAFFAPEEKLSGSNGLPETSSFQSMSLSRPILRGLTAIGFATPTPIQSKAVPVALLGKDIVGGAVTGSGKTAAFLLPILERLLYRPKKVSTTRVSILLPTRELAVQCYNVAKKLAQYTDISFALIVGGLSLREQEQTLKRRPDVVIATPGRFIDHMRNTASFVVENLEILVLDEADRMLEEGFADELNEVLKTIPRSRQTMLFSATMTQDVDKLVGIGMNRPVRLMVDEKQQTVSSLTQEFIKLRSSPSDGENDLEHRRLATLLHLCKSVYQSQTIIFLPTKSLAHRVKILFALQGIKSSELHGSMSQEQRLNAIASFRDGSCSHLLATDLASRGLDIPKVETVVNFTVPTTKETYLHRVGRTARAGRSGVSCTLFSSTKISPLGGKGSASRASERTLLRPILRLAKAQKAPLRTRTLPSLSVEALTTIVRAGQDEIDAVMKEEREERLLAQTERDVTKTENMIEHEQEIMSRPRRTWFQSEKDKLAAKAAGKDSRIGLNGDALSTAMEGSKGKKKLSGKQKKKLDTYDSRKQSQGWKKRKDERMGAGVLKPKPKGKHGKSAKKRKS